MSPNGQQSKWKVEVERGNTTQHWATTLLHPCHCRIYSRHPPQHSNGNHHSESWERKCHTRRLPELTTTPTRIPTTRIPCPPITSSPSTTRQPKPATQIQPVPTPTKLFNSIDTINNHKNTKTISSYTFTCYIDKTTTTVKPQQTTKQRNRQHVPHLQTYHEQTPPQ